MPAVISRYYCHHRGKCHSNYLPIHRVGFEETNAGDIDAVGIVNRAVVWVDDGEDRIGYVLRGVDSGFIEHGAIPLEEWDSALGETQQEAWESLKINQNVVFVDSSFALVDPNTGESIAGMNLPIGKSISLIDISNPGNSREVVVGVYFLSLVNYFLKAYGWMVKSLTNSMVGL